MLIFIPKKGNMRVFDVNQPQKAKNSIPSSRLYSAARAKSRLTPVSSLPPRMNAMQRKELLRLLLKQAQFNGFEFQRWFQAHVRPVWPGPETALSLLSEEGRHYTLLFSHDFARCFWRGGAHMSFMVPSITYPRVNSQGDVVQVTRKPFTRRTIKPDVWKYHLSRMAAAEDPIEYICRFLPAHDQIMVREVQSAALVAQA
jgi:hypothetical protein